MAAGTCWRNYGFVSLCIVCANVNLISLHGTNNVTILYTQKSEKCQVEEELIVMKKLPTQEQESLIDNIARSRNVLAIKALRASFF